METSTSIDTRFAAQIGGYLSNTTSDLVHTQDFITNDQINTNIAQGTTASLGEISYTLQELLGSRINPASLFQNYTINSITTIINVITVLTETNRFHFQFSIAPLSGSNNLSNTDPRSLGGCSSKIFASNNTGDRENPESGQLIECHQPNPLYTVPALSTTQTLDGQQYSNKPLALITNFGTDASVWRMFLYLWNRIATTGTPAAGTITLNIINKVNVTFSGLRWNPGGLFLGSNPLDYSDSEDTLVLHNPYKDNGKSRVCEDSESDSECEVLSDISNTLGLFSSKLSTLSHPRKSGQSKNDKGHSM